MKGTWEKFKAVFENNSIRRVSAGQKKNSSAKPKERAMIVSTFLVGGCYDGRNVARICFVAVDCIASRSTKLIFL
jgi:hypothetical protein